MSYRYEELAGQLENAIAKGVFRVGERLPSIRQACAQHRVSMATVMEAYSRLEERGLIESRPKSGHFVRLPVEARRVLPISRPRQKPGEVSVSRLAMDVLAETSRPGTVPFGAGLPGPDMLPLTEVGRCLSRAARMHFVRAGQYEAPIGAAALREAVARHVLEMGCTESADDIVISNGGQEALMLALRAVTSPNDVVVVESPTYFGVLQALEALGLRALELPTHPQSGIDLESLEAAARREDVRACILMPNYQNPLGFRMSDPDKERAVDVLARYGVTLIEDDVFGTLGLATPRPRAAKSFDLIGNVILCGSFSKTVSPALRLGWLAPGRHIDEVLRHKFLLNISTAMIPQLALAEFLRGNRFRRVTQSAARVYARRLQVMRDAVIENFPDGTTCSTPLGGFFLWVEMPRQFDSMVLYRQAAKSGISISPGRLFTHTNGNRNSFRLNCAATDDAEIERAVAKLGKLAKANLLEGSSR